MAIEGSVTIDHYVRTPEQRLDIVSFVQCRDDYRESWLTHRASGKCLILCCKKNKKGAYLLKTMK
ncbi:MAG: hypothetical protein A2878_02245 [Candidatus Moranbacteria bacterium RIFCSPHIGHO2_01_FULL_54_31]|nr:MAG: hypothetical protein A2878_02245 [Candidatus Moranbacteria bacterium RIFCSPHIGHO2_01_FULL_54_31]